MKKYTKLKGLIFVYFSEQSTKLDFANCSQYLRKKHDSGYKGIVMHCWCCAYGGLDSSLCNKCLSG